MVDRASRKVLKKSGRRVTGLLASAAWNDALGNSRLRADHRKLLKQFDWDGDQPWPELVSTDTEQMISFLVQYKREHFPNDRRVIVAGGMSPEGTVQIQWLGENDLVKAQPPKIPVEAVLARNLVASIKRQVADKVINLKDLLAGRAMAAETQQTVVTEEELASLHPAHAAYVFAQNQVSVLAEQLTALPEMAPFAELISKAEDEYMPSGPPMSPLTLLLHLLGLLRRLGQGSPGDDRQLHSRAWRRGRDAGRVAAPDRLHAEITHGPVCARGQWTRARDPPRPGHRRSLPGHRPRGLQGPRRRAVVRARFPPPTPAIAEHVVFPTPYLVLKPGPREWEAYFRRVLPDAPKQARLDAYQQHMKFGPSPRYWTEYVFEGYVNHELNVIFLRGLPDVPESRPHSRGNS